MKIVINITEEIYKNLQERSTEIQAEGCVLENAVLNGTPLPKGHGRLIDENNLWFEDIDDISCVTQRNVENTLTIVEADKAESEDKE